MSDAIDRLRVELEGNFREVIQEFAEIDEKTDGLANNLKSTEKCFVEVTASSDDFSETLNETVNSTKELTAEVKKIGEQLSKMSNSADDASEKTKKVGDAADKSSGKLNGLKSILGAFGITIGLSAVIEAVKSIGQFAYDSAQMAQEAMQNIAISTGAAGDELKFYLETVKNISRTNPVEMDDLSSIVGDVSTLNRGLFKSNEELYYTLVSEYSALLKMHPEASVQDLDASFKKWGITTDEQTKYLAIFHKVSQDTTVSISTLSSLLQSGDRAFQLLGMSAEEAAAYIGNAKYEGEIDDVYALINAVEMLQAQKSKELGSDEAASKYIQDLMTKVRGLHDESEAVQYLTSDAVGLGDKVARALAASAFGKQDGSQAVLNSAVEEGRKATEAYKGYLSEYVQSLNTVEEKWTIIWNNMHQVMEPAGVALSKMVDYLLELSQLMSDNQWLDAFDRVAKSWMGIKTAMSAPFIGPILAAGVPGIVPSAIEGMFGIQQPTAAAAIEPTTTSNYNTTTINQYITAPVADAYTVQNATEKALTASESRRH